MAVSAPILSHLYFSCPSTSTSTPLCWGTSSQAHGRQVGFSFSLSNPPLHISIGFTDSQIHHDHTHDRTLSAAQPRSKARSELCFQAAGNAGGSSSFLCADPPRLRQGAGRRTRTKIRSETGRSDSVHNVPCTHQPETHSVIHVHISPLFFSPFFNFRATRKDYEETTSIQMSLRTH